MAKKFKKKRYCSHCQHQERIIDKLSSQLEACQIKLIQKP